MELAIRIIANLLIIIGCTMCGFYASNRLKMRLQILVSLENGIRILEKLMFFEAQTLPFSFEKAALSLEKPVQLFFSSFSLELKKRNGQPVGVIWRASLENSELKGYLQVGDMQMIAAWGDWLGMGSQAEQQKTISQIRMEASERIDQVHKTLQKDAKLYRKLGMLAGLLIVIILF